MAASHQFEAVFSVICQMQTRNYRVSILDRESEPFKESRMNAWEILQTRTVLILV